MRVSLHDQISFTVETWFDTTHYLVDFNPENYGSLDSICDMPEGKPEYEWEIEEEDICLH